MTVLEMLNETPAKFDQQGQTKFGKLQLYLVKVANAANESFSIPGVRAGSFQVQAGKADASGNLLFNGLRKGGGDLLLVQVLTRQNQQGEDYQQIKQYRSREFTGATVHKYKEFGVPPIRNFFGQRLDDYLGQTSDNIVFSGKPAFVQLDEKPTGEEFDGKAITYWEIVNEYPTHEAMKVAEDEFWERVRGGGQGNGTTAAGSGVDKLTLLPTKDSNDSGWTPESWIEAGVPAVLKGKQDNKPDAVIAHELGLDVKFVTHVVENVPF